MSDFVIFPAIDLLSGEVVRLQQGRSDQKTVYSREPQAVAQEWIDQGAQWLHVVNLNGAFGKQTRKNEAAIQAILAKTRGGVKVQIGGGFRKVEEVASAFSLGVSRIVIGTAVIENPPLGRQLIDQFGADRIAFGLDALDQNLMSHGWRTNSGISVENLAEELAHAGAQTLIYTNIQRDGMQTGVDWGYARRLAEQSALQVIASGGVATLEDIGNVCSAGLSGVIIGKALYEGNFSLQEALNVREKDHSLSGCERWEGS
jgi:phosphoribosylformimino-5-aminoimidazole carboxamide ribotide isomerase